MVSLTAFKAAACCSGVPISPETISIMFPPNFGCTIDSKIRRTHQHIFKNRVNHSKFNLRKERVPIQRIHTIKILDKDAINRATVAIISFPASGFAWNVIQCQQLQHSQWLNSTSNNKHQKSATYKCKYSTEPHVCSLKVQEWVIPS